MLTSSYMLTSYGFVGHGGFLRLGHVLRNFVCSSRLTDANWVDVLVLDDLQLGAYTGRLLSTRVRRLFPNLTSERKNFNISKSRKSSPQKKEGGGVYIGSGVQCI